MTLDVEMVVHGGMDRKKALRGADQFETLHLALSDSGMGASAIAKEMGIGRASVYRALG